MLVFLDSLVNVGSRPGVSIALQSRQSRQEALILQNEHNANQSVLRALEGQRGATQSELTARRAYVEYLEKSIEDADAKVAELKKKISGLRASQVGSGGS